MIGTHCCFMLLHAVATRSHLQTKAQKTCGAEAHRRGDIPMRSCQPKDTSPACANTWNDASVCAADSTSSLQLQDEHYSRHLSAGVLHVAC